ncbi:MAG: glycerol-3-phosphate 1-O-acyltransferase PlsY [Candidatus Sulfotelmatobacter sp.]
MSTLIVIAASSYLLGSIPFGYLLVLIFRGEDVRQSGSGNIGATNVSRTSPVLGIATLLLDALKGTTAALLSYFLWIRMGLRTGAIDVLPFVPMSLAALFAVLGHMFPVWLRFHGGKGVATALGSFAIVAPTAVLVAAAIFIGVVIIFRYVSLGSILAVASFPFLVFAVYPWGHTSLILSMITTTSLLIVVKHHENIRRILAGTENRVGAKRA